MAARTNILFVTWQEDLAVPEQPRVEGEGAPAGAGEEVSGALSVSSFWVTAFPLAVSPPVVPEQPLTGSHFPESLDKKPGSSVFVVAASFSWEFSMRNRWTHCKLLPDLG